MSDRLGFALNYMETKRRQCMVRSIRYIRHSEQWDMDATVGRTTAQAAGPLGMIDLEQTDFIIAATALADIHPPQPGDRIAFDSTDETQLYEVCGISGEPAWRWSDPEHRAIRIHAKYLGTEMTA